MICNLKQNETNSNSEFGKNVSNLWIDSIINGSSQITFTLELNDTN